MLSYTYIIIVSARDSLRAHPVGDHYRSGSKQENVGNTYTCALRRHRRVHANVDVSMFFKYV